MNNSANKNISPFDKNGDGVRITERGSKGSRSVLFYKLLALVLVGCLVFYLANIVIEHASPNDNNTRSDASVSDESASGLSDANDIAATSTSSLSEEANMRDQKLTARPAQAYDRNDLANYIAPGQTPRMEEVIERLHDAGIHSGLGAFNPPGTSPPMIGLAVPDDYVLPEGYVRHFQATDDGQRIEPILMYSPDFNFVDSAGQPIVIPNNRVVPNNRAPPGLIIRPIKIPIPRDPGKP
jgi:hypothetical protein